MYKSRILLVLLFFAILITLVASCSSTRYKSNGERIYFAATSSSGKPIASQGFTMMHGRIACVNCHGADGHGGNVNMMMTSFEAPNITWGELTGQHESHAPYTEATIKDAITKGVEPNGEELEIYMPRWQMAEEDLDDLLIFLKTLK
ncbi:c-type cytochrome [Chloroflexota bacterium]